MTDKKATCAPGRSGGSELHLAILAAGAWGTGLAIALGTRHSVKLWTRDVQVAHEISTRGENARFLPGYRLPSGVGVEVDLKTALCGAEALIIATSLAGLRPVLRQCRDVRADAGLPPILWVCKGFEPESGLLPHQVVFEELGASAACGVLTGPSFAQEVAAGLPVALTLASRDGQLARTLAANLHGGRLRIYANDDLIGAEVGGAVKNVMAIAAGICDGLGFGHNARAALITRGLAEMARLGVALGGQSATFMGLAGMGDLILTCTGDLSRNRRVGLALAAGQPIARILQELGHVAEGVSSAHEVSRLAGELHVDMPISLAVASVLRGEQSAQAAVEALLERDPKVESD